MLTINTFNFLRDLKENNDREWFAENKKRYEAARAELEGLIANLLPEMNKIDPSVGFPEPKKCIFRIYRDTRFATNKEPYKTNMGAALCPDEFRRSWDYSMYYLHIEQGKSFISAGIYMPRPAILKAIRTAVYENFDDFKAILNQVEFKKSIGDIAREGDVLKRVPNGFEKEHPSAEYLKLKSFYVFKSFTDEELCKPNFIQQALTYISIMKPLNQWLNEVIADVEE